MSKRDYYEVLGLSRDATSEQVKKSYRKLAIQFHPDKNPDNPEAEEKFKEASEAYQVLSDKERRARYDQFGHAAFSGGSGFEGFGDFSSFADEIFGDLFSSFFGASAGRRATRVRQGRDVQVRVEIDLEEAAKGVSRTIEFQRPCSCETCSGSGAKPGTTPEMCKQCQGQGQVRVQQGFFAIARTCPVCRGAGTFVVDPCADCNGSGQTHEESELMLKIPEGIDHGQRLKIRGEGERIFDGVPGDLYAEIAIRPHPHFTRQETEILCEVPINYTQAVLGTEIEVPTLDGTVSMKIPPGTPSGKVFRMKGKGIVDMQVGRKGDQHVRVYVCVPQQVTERQQELLRELAEIEGTPVANDARTFFDKVKDLFD